jgi:hypothetical protein
VFEIRGKCATYPAVSNLAFMDRAKGGPANADLATCEARRQGWQAACGWKAKVTMRLEPTALVHLREARAAAEPVVAERAAATR